MKSVALVISSVVALVLGVLEIVAGSVTAGGSTAAAALLAGAAGLVLANRRSATAG